MKMNFNNVGRGLSDIAGAVEKRRTKKMLQEAYGNAKRDAEAGSGTLHTLDKGGDDPATADYQSKDASTIDMIAGQEDFINEAPAREQAPTQTRTASGAETFPLADVRPRGTPLLPGGASEEATAAAALEAGAPAGLETVAAKPAMSTAPGTGLEMSAVPAPGTTAPPGEAPEAGYRRESFERPQLNTMDVFHKKYAPQVVAKMMEAGDIEKAQAFESWSRSAKGAAYGDAWMKAAIAQNAGDTRGALAGVQELYNKMVPDGQYALVKPGKDGEYTVEVRDEKSNKLVGSQTGKGGDIAQLGVGMLTPAAAYEQIHGAQVTAANKADALAKEERDQVGRERIAEINNQAKPTALLTAIDERAAIAAANPNDPRLAALDDKIQLMRTRSEGGTTIELKMGTTPQEMAGGGQGIVIATPPGRGGKGGSAGLTPIAGAPNRVAEAEAFTSGYEYKTFPGGKIPMLFRKGTDKMASKEEEAEYGKAQILLQKNAKPGLK